VKGTVVVAVLEAHSEDNP